MKTRNFALLFAMLAAFLSPQLIFAQTDPGVQGGAARAGSPLASVNTTDGSMQFFQDGLSRFRGHRVRLEQPHRQQRSGAAV